MKPFSEQTLYEILEIPDDAPSAEIERAYQRARAIYQPGSLASYTLMAPDEAADLGRRIEEAKAVLLDPVARAGYDARLATGTPLPRTGHTHDSTPTVTATAPPGFEVSGPAPGARAAAGPPAPAEAAVVEAAPRAVVVEAPAPAVLPQLPPLAPDEPAASPRAVTPIPLAAALPARAAAQASAAPPSSPPFAALAERPAAEVVAAPARSAERPLVFPDDARWSGELLRQAREARGISVAQLAERTRISRHHIENVEADSYPKLPAAVYLRGIVMALARELRLDGQKVARSYLETMAAARGGPH